MLLLAHSDSATEVMLLVHFRYAIFCLVVLMCFGVKIDEGQIREIKHVQHRTLIGYRRFKILEIFPRLGKIIFRNLWKELSPISFAT